MFKMAPRSFNIGRSGTCCAGLCCDCCHLRSCGLGKGAFGFSARSCIFPTNLVVPVFLLRAAVALSKNIANRSAWGGHANIQAVS